MASKSSKNWILYGDEPQVYVALDAATQLNLSLPLGSHRRGAGSRTGHGDGISLARSRICATRHCSPRTDQVFRQYGQSTSRKVLSQLAKMGDTSLIPTLDRLTTEASPALRKEIRKAIKLIQNRAAPELRGAVMVAEAGLQGTLSTAEQSPEGNPS